MPDRGWSTFSSALGRGKKLTQEWQSSFLYSPGPIRDHPVIIFLVDVKQKFV